MHRKSVVDLLLKALSYAITTHEEKRNSFFQRVWYIKKYKKFELNNEGSGTVSILCFPSVTHVQRETTGFTA